jgi:S1-C subfamily serine protease
VVKVFLNPAKKKEGGKMKPSIVSRIACLVALGLLLLAALAPGCSKPGSETISREALAQVEAATVFIEAKYRPVEVLKPDARELMSAWGSGFVIAREGLILTNEHVVASWVQADMETGRRATPATLPSHRRTFVLHSVTVRTNSGSPEGLEYPAQVLCTRGMPWDLALLRIRPQEKLTSLQLIRDADFKKLDKTSRVWAVGFPLGRDMELSLRDVSIGWDNPNGPEISVRSGTITAIRHGEDNRARVVEHSCNIEHGNSGGPLVDDKGRVLGIVYLGVGEATRFAIPAPVARQKFKHVLAWRCDRDEGGKRKKSRTLLVDADSEDAYPSVKAAVEAVRPGDTIDISAGTYELDDRLQLPNGVYLRGMGIDKTTLLGLLLIRSGTKFAEVSDLTVQSKETETLYFSSELEFDYANYIHDIRVIQPEAYSAVIIMETGSRDLVNCFIEVNGSYPLVTPVVIEGIGPPDNYQAFETKLERIRFDDSALEPAESEGPKELILVSNKATPSIVGCEFDSPKFSHIPVNYYDCAAIRVEGDSHPKVSGCYFRFDNPWLNHSNYFAIDVRESGGEYRANYFQMDSLPGSAQAATMRLDPGPTTVEDNTFQSSIPVAQALNDPSPPPPMPMVYCVDTCNLQFKGNLLDGCDVALVRVKKMSNWHDIYEIEAEFTWPDLGNEYIDSR